jgi:hypothetical protein
MRKLIATAALTTAALAGGMSLTATAAFADPVGPCDVQDTPNYTYDGRNVSVDLHTQLECFKIPVSVG